MGDAITIGAMSVVRDQPSDRVGDLLVDGAAATGTTVNHTEHLPVGGRARRQRTTRRLPARRSRRSPDGVQLPRYLAAQKIGASLAASCTVVLAPSPLAPLSTLLFGRLARDVIPAGVRNIVSGKDPSSAMLAHSTPASRRSASPVWAPSATRSCSRRPAGFEVSCSNSAASPPVSCSPASTCRRSSQQHVPNTSATRGRGAPPTASSSRGAH
jgi:hypothetical protein